jgi:hypothetical protein
MILDQDYSVLWTFSDDYARCPDGECTHTAEYQSVGDSTWTPLDVTGGQGYAYVDLPVEAELQNATTYAFRFSVIDCAGQSTTSEEYYFRVAVTDAPPVIGDGPFVAAGAWPKLALGPSKASVLNQNESVLWTFSDDYASCLELCTHRARYKKVDAVDWTWVPVNTDPNGESYAYTELPVESLEAGTYHFYFDVRDCAGQLTRAPRIYYFKVAQP